MIIQLCGLSGSGKTTLALCVKERLAEKSMKVEIIDGDEYRKVLCKDLGFTKEDRHENIRRLSFVANKFSNHGIIAIISAINPYDEIRNEVKTLYENVKVIYLHCPLSELIQRDTKGLYKKALLYPADHPEKITNLSGVNDQFDVPQNPDLCLDTHLQAVDESTDLIVTYLLIHSELKS